MRVFPGHARVKSFCAGSKVHRFGVDGMRFGDATPRILAEGLGSEVQGLEVETSFGR